MFSLWRKARRENSAASRLLGSTSLRFALHGWQRAVQPGAAGVEIIGANQLYSIAPGLQQLGFQIHTMVLDGCPRDRMTIDAQLLMTIDAQLLEPVTRKIQEQVIRNGFKVEHDLCFTLIFPALSGKPEIQPVVD
ncbi:hypothetical protein [Thiolapillus sp.]|uniref:hypothetical protein n=1 Tax=Thiolapillus sp. TaxID=2017437 RepID=UPI003AF94DFD